MEQFKPSIPPSQLNGPEWIKLLRMLRYFLRINRSFSPEEAGFGAPCEEYIVSPGWKA